MEAQERAECQHRERLINRRTQGDLGEFSAMEWLASKGALVWIPLGHSPDVDLIAEVEDQVIRVQVKTSTYRITTPRGRERWAVSVQTNGGNQSWSGTTKRFDPARVDHLFVLVGDGRRWLIPATVVEASRRLSLGGTKYSEFEVERGQPIEHLVYPGGNPDKLDRMQGECLSGQKDQTVNLAAMPSQVRILPPPSNSLQVSPRTSPCEVLGDVTRSERKLARSGHTLLRQKRQATIPKRPCAEAGLRVGDRMRARADRPGRIVLERVGGPSALGAPMALPRTPPD
jgi:PD-(D/E)XK nuclease superfamily protein